MVKLESYIHQGCVTHEVGKPIYPCKKGKEQLLFEAPEGDYVRKLDVMDAPIFSQQNEISPVPRNTLKFI